MARWFVNPRKRKAKRRRKARASRKRQVATRGRVQHRPRLRFSGTTFVLGTRSPYKGKYHRVNPIIRNPIIRNPFIREIGMSGYANPYRRRHRRNPSIIRNPINGGAAPSIGNVMRNPLNVVSSGFVAVGSAYMTNSVPNMFGLFAGPDMVSKLLRGVVRIVVGGFVYGAVRSLAPRHASAAAVGAAMGSIGATVLDLMNTRLVLGYGDQTQTPMMLFAGVGSMFSNITGGTPAVGAYTRPMGAYTRPMGGMRGFRGIYGSGSMSMVGGGSSIYGG